MELTSLHPFDPDVARRYVRVLRGEEPVPAEWRFFWGGLPANVLEQARSGNEQAANNVTFGLAQALARAQPVFFHDGFGLSVWEARTDRGVGMLMRPPSRLFADAGLDAAASRVMPIRLDLQHGMMGGAWIPARLVPDLANLVESRLERMARRLHEGDDDPFAMLGLLLDATRYAQDRGLGLFEAMDVVGPDGEAPPDVQVVRADRKRLDPEIRMRIEAAIKPPRKPGLLSRVLGRSRELDVREGRGLPPGTPPRNGGTSDPEQA